MSAFVLSFGPTWETAWPVAFESRSLKGAELHYPTHEQELLSIIHALQKWRSDLLGSRFFVFTDHKTLQNFDSQKDLSMRQMRWMEYLSQYEYSIHYINGEMNCIADALSRYPEMIARNNPPPALPIASIFEVNSDPSFLDDICTGYVHDVWCSQLIGDVKNKKLDFKLDVSLCNGLLFTGNRLIIPRFKGLQEQIFRLAHDNLRHFGGDKMYENLRHEFYWPHMRHDLIQGYIPSCSECQRNKS